MPITDADLNLTLTRAELNSLVPCARSDDRVAGLLGGSGEWADRRVGAAEARDAGVDFGDILWAAVAVARVRPTVERRMRMWAADCAARVLLIYERDGDSTAPREAIVAARRYARGEIDDAALAVAWDAAKTAARDYAKPPAARYAAWSAATAAWVAPRGAPRTAASVAAGDAAGDASAAAGDAAGDAWSAACAAERAWQFDRLVLWLSPEEPEDWPLPERLPSGSDAIMNEV